MTTPLDELIEEAWLIFQRERDGLPCSIRRNRLLLLCRETLQDHQMPVPLPPSPITTHDQYPPARPAACLPE